MSTLLLSFLADERGLDLRDYRREVIDVQLARRIAQAGHADSEDYLRRLRCDPAEVDRLVRTLLISVTRFFREPATFDRLCSELPQMLSRRPGDVLRAWVVGAASGEEAWSLAMLMQQACERVAGAEWEVLASDVDEEALRTAAEARYPLAAVEAVPPGLAARFLLPDAPGHLRIAPELRRHVRFARHDVLGPRLAPAEALVASFDLVLCRNMLIYFTRRLQEKAGQRLLSVLRPGGLLVLGLSESLAGPLPHGVRLLAPDLKTYRLDGEP